MEIHRGESMKVETEVSRKEIIGTSRIGVFSKNVTIKKIRSVFGKDIGCSSDGKTTHEWISKIDGEIVTIYDYKGDRWHVGGKVSWYKREKLVAKVKTLLGINNEVNE